MKILLPFLALALASCSYKDPSDEVNKQIEASIRKFELDTETITDTLKQGGQPGRIIIDGGLIIDDPSSERFGQPDPRVTVLAQGGIGHKGDEAKVLDNYKPVLTPHPSSASRRFSSDRSLISIGCSPDLVSDYASLKNLTIAQVPAPITEDLLGITAHTILLCGKIPQLKESYLSLNSQELVMMDAELHSNKSMGAIIVDTAQLILSGRNKIKTQGASSPYPTSLTNSIHIKVLFALDQQSTGTLEVLSVGSSYQAESPSSLQ